MNSSSKSTTETTKALDARFLRLAFSSIHIPPAVLPSVLDLYMSRFAFAFAQNHFLTAGISPLVQELVRADDYDDLISLLHTNNHYVLDTLLDTNECRGPIFRIILDTWVLSPKDQLRLVNRRLPHDIFARIMISPEFTNEVRQRATVGAGHHVDYLDTLSVRTLSARAIPPPSKKSYVRYPRPTEEMWDNASVHLTKTIAIFATLQRLTVISGVLNSQLGDGTNPLSLTTWMNFLGLCRNDPDVKLSTVIDTAKSLARAELAAPPLLSGTGR